MKTVVFPGSFDPFTLGHANLVERALRIFDQVIIAVGYNVAKPSWIPVNERVRAVQELYQAEPRVQVMSYNNLTVDFAKENNAGFILRGVRTMQDYEYELQMADINRMLDGIETVVLFTDSALSSISSSRVRELHHFGHDITQFLPQGLKYNI
ncbi:MAG: pantetheine-phosphate adenylyltransferase [Bacteroidaceae bacterium]|nr:pantetheine-phosphate adenylyltransferase [Bacteroidaceae bacterium]